MESLGLCWDIVWCGYPPSKTTYSTCSVHFRIMNIFKHRGNKNIFIARHLQIPDFRNTDFQATKFNIKKFRKCVKIFKTIILICIFVGFNRMNPMHSWLWILCTGGISWYTFGWIWHGLSLHEMGMAMCPLCDLQNLDSSIASCPFKNWKHYQIYKGWKMSLRCNYLWHPKFKKCLKFFFLKMIFCQCRLVQKA